MFAIISRLAPVAFCVSFVACGSSNDKTGISCERYLSLFGLWYNKKISYPESVFSLSLIDHGVGDYNVYFEGRNFLVLRHNSDDQA